MGRAGASAASRAENRFASGTPGVGNRSCCSPRLGPLWADRVPSKAPSLVLQPFAPAASPAPPPLLRLLLDFSSALTREISPGKVQNLSPRADRLYLMRLDDLWASLLVASLPPAPGLAAGSCSCGREFVRAPFGFASRLRLAFRYGRRHRLRLAPFIQLDSPHALGTLPAPSGAASGLQLYSRG